MQVDLQEQSELLVSMPWFHCNCITYSPSSTPVNCSDPATPGNGFIGPYQNTTEGAEISFSCNSGFVPNTTRMATCGADGRWNPDPATHMCICEPLPMDTYWACFKATSFHIWSLSGPWWHLHTRYWYFLMILISRSVIWLDCNISAVSKKPEIGFRPDPRVCAFRLALPDQLVIFSSIPLQ